jgi:hypothetical protein
MNGLGVVARRLCIRDCIPASLFRKRVRLGLLGGARGRLPAGATFARRLLGFGSLAAGAIISVVVVVVVVVVAVV